MGVATMTTKPQSPIGTRPGAASVNPVPAQSGGDQVPQIDLEIRNKSLTDALQRLAADFDNYKKRAAKEALSTKSLAEKDLIVDLLPVLDHMELAVKTLPGNDGARSGIELMYAQLISTLERHGLSAMDALEKQFNPQLHEALLAEPGEIKNKVIEVLQKGYLLNTSVIRTAKVKISS